nr:MAG TPA: hypothetical protein [Caudoviricetes sp.]
MYLHHTFPAPSPLFSGFTFFVWRTIAAVFFILTHFLKCVKHFFLTYQDFFSAFFLPFLIVLILLLF